eukprot:4658958-Amphidinium_carterae.1
MHIEAIREHKHMEAVAAFVSVSRADVRLKAPVVPKSFQSSQRSAHESLGELQARTNGAPTFRSA